MSSLRVLSLVTAFALTLGLAACGDDAADNAAAPTPPANTNEAEPAGTGGTTNN